MKKTINKLNFLTIFLSIALFSCKKNNVVVDNGIASTDKVYSHLLLDNYVDGRTYFVHENNNKPAKLLIGLSKPSTGETLVDLSFSSVTGAVNGTHYSAPSTIKFKNGSYLDTLNLSAQYSNYAAGRIDTVMIKIASPTYFGQDSVKYYISKYCDVITTDLEGDYANTRNAIASSSVPPYTSSIYTFTRNPTDSFATSTFAFLVYRNGSGTEFPLDELPFKIDWSDESNFNIVIPETSAFINGNNSYNVKTSIRKKSSFSACSQTFILYLDFINNVTNLPLATDYKITLQR